MSSFDAGFRSLTSKTVVSYVMSLEPDSELLTICTALTMNDTYIDAHHEAAEHISRLECWRFSG